MKRKTKNNIIFGLSLLEASGNGHAFISGLNEMTHFKGLELPGHFFDDPELPELLSRKNWYYIHASQIVSNSLARSIVEQAPKMIADFVETMEKTAAKLKKFYVDSCSVDFSLEYLPENPDVYQPTVELFKKIAPVFYNTDINFCIPVKIPSASDILPEFFLTFMKEILSPNLRLSIDIYPHRLGKEFEPEGLFRWFRFDSLVVRLVYDAALGNHLLKASVQPWIKYLKHSGFTGAVIFSPRISDAEAFLKEAAVLHQMISEFDKS